MENLHVVVWYVMMRVRYYYNELALYLSRKYEG